ncbi:MAG: SDR family NAD(P)-dependent oxidoreductase [Gemmatimonadota bacterium]|jgi:NADP-dependent 3-hydroxy acid dehydrogenase YdfG
MASSPDLAGRRVVVTGASSGIGLATARRLAEAGAALVLVARGRDRLEGVARDLGAESVAADTADAVAVDALRDRVLEGGTPFAVVNAAGGFDLASVADTTPEMFDRMLDGNLRGPFLVIRAFLPALLEAGEGVLVTVGSVAGRVPFAGNGAYSASKFGVRGLHAVLAQELRGTGVRSTLVEPGATDTPIWDPHGPDRRDDLPDRSTMLPADAVADAIVYILTRPTEVHLPAVSIQRS